LTEIGGDARVALAALAACAALACGGGARRAPDAAPAPPRPAVIEMVGDVGVVPLEVRGFDRLAPADRAMAYYLARAALAGRDIAYDEGGPANLEIRDLLEEILTHPKQLDPAFRDRLLAYLKAFWINNGNHDRVTGVKFVPAFAYDELRAGARAARIEGAGIRLAVGESLPAKLERLRPAIFDAAVEPVGGCGGDPASPSAAPRPARHAAALRTMTGFLAKAAAFAGAAQRADLLRLSAAVLDGTAAARLEGWLRLDPAVDTAAGAVTGCRSAHGRDGSWRGLVWMSEPEGTRRLRALAAEAPRLLGSDHTAAAAAGVATTGAATIDAVSATVLVAIGAAGPEAPRTLTVPDDAGAAGAAGRRCLVLGNVLEAGDRALLEPIVREFAAPEDRPLLLERGRAASFALAALHAVLGHVAPAARRPAAAPPDRRPDDARGVLEEARADLVALHHLFDARLVAAGFLAAPDDAGAALRLYLVRALALLRTAGADGRLAGDEPRAAHLVAAGLRERGAGVEETRSDGRTWLRVTDLEAARRDVGALLGEVERLLAGGDGREARGFVERFASRADPARRAEIARRAARAGICSRVACVMADVIPVRDGAGEVVDARIGPIADFTLQMLRYSGKLPAETAAH